MKKKLIIILSVCILCAYLIFNFFVVGKYAAYPWWHSHGNDADGSYAASAVALINNGDLYYIYHPGAAVFSLEAFVFRFLSVFDTSHQKMLHLMEVSNINEASDILEIATRTGRILALLISIVFLIVFYRVLYLLTNHKMLSFLMTFYLITSHAYQMYTYWIRPELLNLLFFIGALGLCLNYYKKVIILDNKSLSLFIFIGMLFGFSVFSKIQIGPAIAIFVMAIIIFQFLNGELPLPFRSSKIIKQCLIVSFLNLIFMPWWALKRPTFLTIQYLNSLHPLSESLLIYGSAPDHFYLPVLSILLMLMLVSILFMVLTHQSIKSKLINKILPSLLFINCMVCGLIISGYTILIPASVSVTQYIENTNHLVYSIFTNISSGGFLKNKIDFVELLRKIISLHQGYSSILNFNILYIVFGSVLVSLVRLFLKTSNNRKIHILILCFFMTGFMMDIFAGFRPTKRNYIYSYYAIYSLSFYVLGFALWLSTEFMHLSQKSKEIIFKKVFYTTMIGCLMAHFVLMSYKILKKPRATGVTSQSPLSEYRNVRSHGKSFWKIVDKSIERTQS